MSNILFCASSPGVGLTYYLTEISIALKKNGHNLVVLSSEKEDIKGLSKKLKKNHIKHYVSPHVDSNSITDIFNGSKLIREIIKSENIDIIHANVLSHFIKAYLASRFQRRNLAIVLTIHSLLPFYMRNSWLLKILGRMADLIIPVCDSTEEKLVFIGIPSHKIMTVNNGIDLKLFNYEFTRNNKPFNVIGYVATLYPWKGHIYFFKAAQQVIKIFPNTKFLVIGDGPLRKDLERTVKELDIEKNVEFLGQIHNDEIPEIIKNIDIGVSTSLTEQFPYSIMELMAAGKPIIATDVGCIPKMVKNDFNGYVIPPEDSMSLAKNILILLKNPEKAIKMGENSRKHVENLFTMSNMLNKLEIGYEKALKNV